MLLAAWVFGFGSIPACAGETMLLQPLVEPGRVDPRVRGGDIAPALNHALRHGRSPRARGRRRRMNACVVTERSIPACAGETP